MMRFLTLRKINAILLVASLIIRYAIMHRSPCIKNGQQPSVFDTPVYTITFIKR